MTVPRSALRGSNVKMSFIFLLKHLLRKLLGKLTPPCKNAFNTCNMSAEKLSRKLLASEYSKNYAIKVTALLYGYKVLC